MSDRTLSDYLPDVNRILKDDEQCKVYMPLANDEDAAQAFSHGIVFAKLLNKVQEGAVDMNDFQMDNAKLDPVPQK